MSGEHNAPQGDNTPKSEEPSTISGEEFLLALAKAIATGETRDGLLAMKVGDLEKALKKVMAFRLRGTKLADGSIEVNVAGENVRVSGRNGDFAIGDRAIARQKVADQEAAKGGSNG